MSTKLDSSQVLFKPDDVGGASTDVQAAIRTLNAGGVGGAPAAALPRGGTALANFSLTNATPNGRAEYANTVPLTWATGVGKMSVDFEFLSTGFFALNPASHLAVILRQEPDTVATVPTGNGVILGNLTWTGFNGDEALFMPTIMLETWDPTKTATERYIFPDSTGPRGIVLVDGVRYRLRISSTVAEDGTRWMGYALYKYTGAAKEAWDLVVDTGDVLDHNTGADFTKSMLVFGTVFTEPLAVWNIAFSNVKVYWGPAGTVATNKSDIVSRFGADVKGDLTFLGKSRRIRYEAGVGPSLLEWFTYQTSTANAGTSLIFKPNGTAKSAGVLFSDNSVSDTVYRVLDVGINDGKAYLTTFNRGGNDPSLDINIGIGNTVAKFTAQGLKLAAGITPIGAQRVNIGLTNLGGGNSSYFVAVSNLDFGAFTADGNISSFLGNTYNPVLIEQAILPSAHLISAIARALIDRGVI